ncbi:paraneoplastic antigen Ma2-like [Thalassophryne amazonica]|uniref:paraneoplastic antigen Ma2-like n=1 Tax=Thalassophryne amazonica TaxID=390379 RepID=UPI00147142BB|nr:paraneoplastic antigen Ma2-like [Thalassophryne amazonica]
MVLCECREVVDPTKIPPEITPISGGSGWKAVYYTEPQLDEFEEKLRAFLQKEGKTLEDIQGLSTVREENSNPEAIIRAVGDIMVRTNKPPDNHSYRRLRTFSGISPTPIGEESLDSWLEQASLLVDEGECSNKEKRRRILESLKGPAMEIIQAVRMTQPDASPHDYIEAIDSIFGTAESGEELYLLFRALHQQPGECMSDFLRRLERSLVKVVQRGGLSASDANKARVEQLIKGSISDLMLLQLKIRERRDNPPTFLNLLREVIEEENRQSVRQSQTTPTRHQRVRTIHMEKEKEPDPVSKDELRAQIKELREMLEERNHSQPQSLSDWPCQSQREKKKRKTETQGELQSLRKQVKALENQMSVNGGEIHLGTPARTPDTVRPKPISPQLQVSAAQRNPSQRLR